MKKDGLASQLAIYKKSIFLIAKLNPLKMIFVTILAVLDGLMPAMNLVLLKFTIDKVVLIVSKNNIYYDLFFYGVIWIAVISIQYTISSLNTLVIEKTVNQAVKQLSFNIINKATSFKGLRQFEKSDYHKLSEWLGKLDPPISTFIYEFNEVFKYVTQFISVFFIFSSLGIWIPLLLALSIIPGVILTNKSAVRKSGVQEAILEKERYANYIRRQVISSESAKEVILFNFRSLFKDISNALFTEIEDSKNKVAGSFFRSAIIGDVIRVVSAVVVFLYVVSLAQEGVLSPGSLALYFQAIFQFSTSMLQIINIWSFTRVCYDFFSRFFHFMSLEDSISIAQQGGILLQTIKEIEFRNVFFSYNEGTDALKNVSFKIGIGDKIAIVGENGAGKSTIVKLLIRFYDPRSGQILINGIDCKEYNIDSYREKVSAVFQDFNKYELTLGENIWAKSSHPVDLDDQYRQLIRTLLSERNDSLSVKLGVKFGGKEVSGGEWQRIAILRGLLKEHDLLVVDEPTSSIDPIEEANVYKTISKLSDSITVFITHRLGSIKHASSIIVMNSGEIHAIGTHGDLMDSCPYYRTLYNSQAEMYTNQ